MIERVATGEAWWFDRDDFEAALALLREAVITADKNELGPDERVLIAGIRDAIFSYERDREARIE